MAQLASLHLPGSLLSLGYTYIYSDLCIDTSTGICPINRDIFANAEFVSSELIDWPIPAAERLKTTAPQTVENTSTHGPYLLLRG